MCMPYCSAYYHKPSVRGMSFQVLAIVEPWHPLHKMERVPLGILPRVVHAVIHFSSHGICSFCVT